jgi:hypothetical protein
VKKNKIIRIKIQSSSESEEIFADVTLYDDNNNNVVDDKQDYTRNTYIKM